MTTWFECTRLHDDAVRVAAQVNESEAPLRYMTYAPEYLTEGSCYIGSNNNCDVHGPMNVDNEHRIGELTNKRVLNRPTTQEPNDGRVGGPNKTRGSNYVPEGPAWFDYTRVLPPNSGLEDNIPLNQDKFDVWDTLRQSTQFDKPCDLNVIGQPVTNHMDPQLEMSRPQVGYANRLLDRDAIFRETRVERRNDWAETCPR